MGGLLLVITITVVIVAFFRSKKEGIPAFKSGSNKWYMDFVGLILVASCFFVAWGFGLPATRPLNLGILRLVFQIIFIIFCVLCGIFLILFCLLFQQVREAIFCCCYQRKKGSFDVTENPYFTEQHLDGDGDNVYAMEAKGANDEGGLHYQNEAVDYSFSENLYEPYEADTAQAAPPGVDVVFVEPEEDVKKNSAALDNETEDLETTTKL